MQLVAPSTGAQGGRWPQGSASRWGTDGAPTETRLLELLKLLCGRERGRRGKEEWGQPRDPCWPHLDGYREWMDTPPTWCHTLLKLRQLLTPSQPPSHCSSHVLTLHLARPPAEGTQGAAGEEGSVTRNGEKLLAGDMASCPGAEGEDKGAEHQQQIQLAAPTCPWTKEVRGGLSPPGNLLPSQCFTKKMNAQTVHHWLCCTFPFTPLTSSDSDRMDQH